MKITKFNEFVNESSETVEEFQQKRIDAFDNIKEELLDLIDLCGTYKKETVEYYKNNPKSWGVVVGTDFILEQIDDIRETLTGKRKN